MGGMSSEELARAHWGYIEGLLQAHGTDQDWMRVIEYHYITAFVHGYKHALEDVSNGDVSDG